MRILLAVTTVAASAASWSESAAQGTGSVNIVTGAKRPGFYFLKKGPDGTLRADGSPAAVQVWGNDGSLPPPLLWQPDESRGDAELAKLRTRLAGRLVYGYGGLSISCAPQWTRSYGNAVPLRVVSVMRDKGTFSEIGTGTQIGLNVYGPSFFAADPIRIVFATPRVAPTGTNYGVSGRSGPCPALVLADFQIASTLSVTPPPSELSCPTRRIPLGITREELIWCRGYPWEIADAETLRREPTWHYGVGLSSFVVTFSHDKIVAVDPR
jgi:hypothetical protein